MLNYFKDIEDISRLLIHEMRQIIPDCNYTLWILGWDDNTFQVECKSGSETPDENFVFLHIYTWYNNEITFKTEIVEKHKNI